MDRPSTTAPATAREIILEIVRNMREGLEPLHYTTLAPSIFHVYLHPGDMERLQGIIPRIIDEARRALDSEVESLNRARLAEKLKLARRNEPKIAPPDGGWQIRILENTDEDIAPGDIEIRSELAMPGKGDFGSGSMTKRIATRRLGGSEWTKQSYEPEPPAPAAGTLAVIDYEDNSGRKSFAVTKDEIVAGRGGNEYWTDLKFDTLPDVSREHFRLRPDPATRQFFLTDVSSLGTTIEGAQAPPNQETLLPARARIGLAGVLYLDFRSTSNG